MAGPAAYAIRPLTSTLTGARPVTYAWHGAHARVRVRRAVSSHSLFTAWRAHAATPQAIDAARKDQKKVTNAHAKEISVHATAAPIRGMTKADRRRDSSHRLPKPVMAPAARASSTATTIAPVMRANVESSASLRYITTRPARLVNGNKDVLFAYRAIYGARKVKPLFWLCRLWARGRRMHHALLPQLPIRGRPWSAERGVRVDRGGVGGLAHDRCGQQGGSGTPAVRRNRRANTGPRVTREPQHPLVSSAG